MKLGLDQGFQGQYPDRRVLNNDSEVVIRPLTPDDEEQLLAFYRALPPETRLRLRQDNTNRKVLQRFLEEIPLGRMVTMGGFEPEGDALVGECSLRIMHHGWARHVGELKYSLMPQWSPTGLGGILIMELVEVASSQGLDKLVYQVLDDQVRLKKMLQDMGFVQEAILRDHATDLSGKKHDIYIMSNYMAELWRKMEDMIMYQEFPPLP